MRNRLFEIIQERNIIFRQYSGSIQTYFADALAVKVKNIIVLSGGVGVSSAIP